MQIDDLQERRIEGGDSISAVLDELARQPHEPLSRSVREQVGDGVAFVTFAYDVDGVSNEIVKYAKCIEELVPNAPVHCIAGNFATKADVILDPSWRRLQLQQADGWDKWEGGKWFARLFYEDITTGTPESTELACEMWRQALELAEPLVTYINDHDIGLLVTINVNSNPGNVAFALAIVLATEVTGCPVISNNHDFFWEGGKAGCKRNPGEEPGPRDHFFRNHDNHEFFDFFQRIFPWNGRRWVQVNINQLQSRRLIDRYHFRPDHVFTVGTALDAEFFRERTEGIRRVNRHRMAQVLGGNPTIEPVPVTSFGHGLTGWMADQRPVVYGAHDGITLDITDDDALYILQPTRVVPRKRIWRDWELIGALLGFAPFREAFEQRPSMTLTLHVSGPVPIEHREALDRVIQSYRTVLGESPVAIRRRLFQAFSVGWQTHPSLDDELSMVDIFQLSDLVVLPSLTEGRGLPIPESAAAGIPLMCSEYDPKAVFDEVIGVGLPWEQTIQYLEFPSGEFSDDVLAAVTSALLEPHAHPERVVHNREAVRERYSFTALTQTFGSILDHLEMITGER